MIYVAQIQSIVRKPICPTYIHDDTTRLLIFIISAIICIYLYYKIFIYLNNDFR
jgi:hypothetical protein